MIFKINDEIISVAWEENESVKELMELATSKPLIVVNRTGRNPGVKVVHFLR